MERNAQADGRLYQSDLMFRRMIEAVREYGIFMLDADGRIATWNVGARRITGYEAVEIIGQHCSRFFTPDDAKAGRPAEVLRQAAMEGGHREEGWGVRKDGNLFWGSALLTPVKDADGTLLGYCVVIRDLTDFRRAQDQLAHSERISTLGRMAGGVAHEFNNVLTAVSGLANLIVMGAKPEDPAGEDAKQIIAVCEKAAVLVRGLLALGRRRPSAQAPVNLNALIESLKPVLIPVLGRRIKVETALDASAGAIVGDADQISQVMMNLCLNARDAINGAGAVRIETKAVTTANVAPLSHGILPPGRFVRLTVADSGPGLSPEAREHLFEPFFSTKKDSDGSGLGLSVVYQIAQSHGAAIDVPAGTGGAEFRLYFKAQA